MPTKASAQQKKPIQLSADDFAKEAFSIDSLMVISFVRWALARAQTIYLGVDPVKQCYAGVTATRPVPIRHGHSTRSTSVPSSASCT